MSFVVTPCSAGQLAEFVYGRDITLLGWLSFDERCVKAGTVLQAHPTVRFTFVSFKETRDKYAVSRRRLNRHLQAERLTHVQVTRSNQIAGFRTFSALLHNALRTHRVVLVDISAFPREYVCILA